jgi:hypothetical protein
VKTGADAMRGQQEHDRKGPDASVEYNNLVGTVDLRLWFSEMKRNIDSVKENLVNRRKETNVCVDQKSVGRTRDIRVRVVAQELPK